MPRLVSQERLDRAVEMYLDGKTFVEIQKELHIGGAAVQRAMTQAGVKS